MTITILGENINIVRPRKIHKSIIPKECWRPRRRSRCKTKKFTPEELTELKEKYEEVYCK
jgi:hypothetical protein